MSPSPVPSCAWSIVSADWRWGVMMSGVDEREHAWDELNRALERLPGWRASASQYVARGRIWVAAAHDARPRGRGEPRESLEAVAATEAEAVAALAGMIDARADMGGG